MVRWHASSCTDPAISITDSKVSCQNCSATYSFDRNSVPQDTAAGLSIPLDQPLGQLRLRWPPSVPYTTYEELNTSHSATATIRDTDKAPVSSERTSEDAAHSTIYRRLEVGQFRLICLDSTKSQSNLIHLDLEQYDLDDCPEYEATSYAWGGEDGDSKPSGPIFIGKFYDVALQTKNCLSMLRYLRPARGVRMVWIDAICINQSNLREREVQVAEMRNIYRNASRVVVYLGPETVLQPTQQHRRRLWLDESQAFEHNDGHTFKELLSHRYFSRVWVIQELLLSKSLLIPLQKFDYHADSTCIKRLDVDWKSTKAPWFEHIASGRVFSRNELCALLDQTWSSEATDLRDKLFAILGLVNTALCDQERRAITTSHQNVDYSLLTDYSLSTQETFIGLVGYVMITLDQRHILEHAAGQKAAPGYPTWLPDMQNPFIWRSPTIAAQRDCDQLQDWYKAISLCCKRVWTITSGFQDKDVYWRSGDISNYESQLWNSTTFPELRLIMSVGNSTNESLSIHFSTAALSINLIRIMQLSSRPRRIADFGSLRVFEFLKAQHNILLCTDLIDLDFLLSDDPTWMFLRDTDGAIGPIVFFLRESQQRAWEKAYELVCCCPCWDLLIFRRPQLLVNSDAADADLPKCTGADGHLTSSLTKDTIKFEHGEICFHQEEIRLSLPRWTQPLTYETLYATAGMIIPDSELDLELQKVFPGANPRLKDTLPLFQLLADIPPLDEISYHQFGELYISMMNQFSSVHCSMESPCDTDYPRLGQQFLKMDIPHRHGDMFFTFDPAIWAEYSQLQDRSEYFSLDRLFSKAYVNQKITKVVTARDRLSTTTKFMTRFSFRTTPEQSGQILSSDHTGEIMFLFQGEDILFWGRTEERDSDQSHNWMGWMGLREHRHDVINKNATVYMCVSLTTIADYMNESALGKRFRNLTKFRSATGQDETTMALNVEERYRNIFAHNWPDSLREEIGLIGEPCRVQIL